MAKLAVVLAITILLSSIFSVVVFEKPLAMKQSLTTALGSEKTEQTPDNITSSSKSYDWPMYQHDTSNTGTSMSPFPNSLNQIWNKSYSNNIKILNYPCFSSPIITNGKVFIHDSFIHDPYGTVYGNYWGAMICAFDENNGSQIWRRELMCLPLLSRTIPICGLNSPAYSNGKLFVSMGLGASLSKQSPFLHCLRSKLFALDENTGDIIWKKTFLGTSFYTSITVADGKVFVGGHLQLPLSRIYVYDEKNGELLWRKNMMGFLESTPVVSDNKVFVVTGSHSGSSLLEIFNIRYSGISRVYAFDINNGKRLWMKPVEGYAVFSSPAAGDGKLFIPSNIIINEYRYDRKIYALDQETGEEIWHRVIEQKYCFNSYTSISTPSLAYGKVFVTDADGWLYALDENNGSLVWEREIIENYSSYPLFANPVISPVVVDGKVIAQAERETFPRTIYICMFKESNGELIWDMKGHYSPGTGPFAVANRKLFINTGLDVIYAYG